jgi:hypothetical protein
MRLAICISGQVRDFASTLPSLRKHVLSGFGTHDVYFFCHTPASESHPFSLGLNFSDILVEDSEPETFDFLQKPPLSHDVEARPWNKTDPLLGYVRQLRSIYLAHQLQNQYAASNGFSFDLVFRLRFDNLYIFPLEPLETIDPSFLYLPAHDSWGGYNDRFAFGCPELMNVYCNRFLHLADYLNEGLFIHPETLLATHLARFRVPVRHTTVVHHLYRHGKLDKACFHPDQGDVPSFTPPQPFMRWRFQVKKYLGEHLYNQLAILWWKFGH